VSPTPADARPVALIAFGGNALVPRGSEGTEGEQRAEAEKVAAILADLARDHRLLLVHGNGPQVGQLLIQSESARRQVPPWGLAACGAGSQGVIGFLLEAALRGQLEAAGLDPKVASLVTLTEVDAADPAFQNPTKPIGPYYPQFVADDLAGRRGWKFVRQDQGWRRVVPSPAPVRIYGVRTVGALLEAGAVVIAGGGGGIPVVRRPDGTLEGVDAVIDKDLTAAMLFREVGADLFVILTNVARVEKDYGTDRAMPIDRMTPREARALMAEGHFPPGSMGPKIEAAVRVVEASGRQVLITSADALAGALRGQGGTRIVPESAPPPG
jgi:carbamate kinase